jgi:hypothetical protein
VLFSIVPAGVAIPPPTSPLLPLIVLLLSVKDSPPGL